jgi:CBS domain-containing protein
MMKASEIMVKDVVTLTMDKNASAMDAARIMNREGIGCLIVVHFGEVVGILTKGIFSEELLRNAWTLSRQRSLRS